VSIATPRCKGTASAKERAEVHAHMRWCLEELTSLVRELEGDDT
jgi:hypothetical protein